MPTKDELTTALLEDLALARPIELPAAVVVAHPDDEMLAMGGTLPKFKHLVILQLTNGAPPEGADGERLGFASCVEYAVEREQEARRALASLGLNCRRIRLNAPDQESVFWIPRLLSLLERELRTASVVFTHPYEGGHPDHDTAALIVQHACTVIHSEGNAAPARFEFASYHHCDGRMVTGRFWPEPGCPETTVTLESEARASKCRALAEYRTQSPVIKWFCTAKEGYRAAPLYEFSRPPPPGVAQYDLFGWRQTAVRWRETAASLLPGIGEITS